MELAGKIIRSYQCSPALFSSCSSFIIQPTWSVTTARWRRTSWLCCGLSPCPCSLSEASSALWWWPLWSTNLGGENLLHSTCSLACSACFLQLMLHPCYRKGTLLFNNIFSIVPAIMMGVSEIAKSYEIIIVARFIVGICAGQLPNLTTAQVKDQAWSGGLASPVHAFPSAGLSSNVVPMYLGEIAPKNLRGALCIVPELFITFGILCAQVLGIRNILGNSTGS